MRPIKNRTELLREFEALPDSAIVDECFAAAFRNRGAACLQRERWAGTGPKFVKDGRLVGYRKSDLIAYVDACVVSPDGAA